MSTETPSTETPATTTPGSETPGSETPGSETPGSEISSTETPGPETSGPEILESTANTSTLASVLVDLDRIFQAHRQQNPQLSLPEAVRLLRAYSRKGYTSRLWALTAGDIPEPLLEISLDRSLTMAQHPVDLAHLIAALSDQFPGGSIQSHIYDLGLNALSLVFALQLAGTADFTSTIGDVGQPIESYLAQSRTSYDAPAFQTLLRNEASDEDLTSDILAHGIGKVLKRAPTMAISGAMQYIDRLPYVTTVHTYLTERLGAKLQGQTVLNGRAIRRQIRRQTQTYVALRLLLGGQVNRARQTVLGRGMLGQLLDGATEHLWRYLVTYGQLQEK